jgi:hypothetical protein
VSSIRGGTTDLRAGPARPSSGRAAQPTSEQGQCVRAGPRGTADLRQGPAQRRFATARRGLNLAGEARAPPGVARATSVRGDLGQAVARATSVSRQRRPSSTGGGASDLRKGQQGRATGRVASGGEGVASGGEGLAGDEEGVAGGGEGLAGGSEGGRRRSCWVGGAI